MIERINIEKAENGFIITSDDGDKRIAKTVTEVREEVSYLLEKSERSPEEMPLRR